jgi:transposase
MSKTEPRSAYLVFIDECGFMLSPLVRRTWAPKGQTPIIKVMDPHSRISAIGAITISPVRDRFGFQFKLLPDNSNFSGFSIVSFVESVRRRLREDMIVLWDQIPIHRSRPVAAYVDEHPDVVIELFPPYAPELNPVDYVWSYVKYGRLANFCPQGLVELRQHVTAELSALRRRPDLLSSFFRATGLTL